jgi:hypothetical protein
MRAGRQRGAWRLIAALLALGLSGASVAAPAPADAVLAVAEVERAMLEEAQARFAALERRAADLVAEIDLLRSALATAVQERESPDPRRIVQLAEQLERKESERAGLATAEQRLVDRIAQHLQRLEQLELQAEGLRAEGEPTAGQLTGTWSLVLMPAGQRGTALLTQSGALLTGTYQLDGGWTGSLQGTLVNRKVFLVRIDSKLGKSMELEGFLSDDGKRIRGSWLDYELAGGEGASGQWTAERQAPE